MKLIKINTAKNKPEAYAIVDDEDYEAMSQYRWNLSKGYAIHYLGKSGHDYRGALYMHRLVHRTDSWLMTDHINGNRLDNRRINLRTCTRGENRMNSPANKNNSTGIKGVGYRRTEKLGKPWFAYTGKRINGRSKTIYFGYYATKEEAAAAYAANISKYQGEFTHHAQAHR